MAIIFGIAVFAVIVVIGWRSVQNRRVLRMQSADGHETIIIAGEDDEVSSITTTTEAAPVTPAAVSPVDAVDASTADPEPTAEFGRKTAI
jgi:hypothetical protein